MVVKGNLFALASRSVGERIEPEERGQRPKWGQLLRSIGHKICLDFLEVDSERVCGCKSMPVAGETTHVKHPLVAEHGAA